MAGVGVGFITGPVKGLAQDGVVGFLGIPFAAPPVGALRYQPAEPHPPWTGLLQTTATGASCVQGAGPPAPPPKSP